MKRKSAYELSQSQVSTPRPVVSLFWRLTNERRDFLGKVLDVGSGDCRFALESTCLEYVGIEIDPNKSKTATVPSRGRVITGCAFKHNGTDYDAIIGNPPYVRHHDIEHQWKASTLEMIHCKSGIRLNKRCNLFLYFMCLGILKTRRTG